MTKLNGGMPNNPELESLLTQINAEYADTAAATGLKCMSDAVERALRAVPREQFVPSDERPYAYANHPLPIGQGQTISQPFIVALMTDLLQLNSDSKVLELGTGCGYQTAVLAEVSKEVYSIEILAELGGQAFARLQEMGYHNIHYRTGDGSLGWPEAAPFDGIIATACADQLPEHLVDQLAPNGRIVIPLAQDFGGQELTLVSKNSNGDISQKNVLGVRFVPVTH